MERIGQFRVLSSLYEDARTRVVRAVDSLDRAVIVKASALLPPTASARARLRREHDICVELASSPGTKVALGRVPVPVSSHERETPAHIAFLDEGGTVVSSVLRRGPMKVALALRVAERVCRVLDAVHACHVIHKDVKPSNLLLAEDGTVTLLDFGIAGRLESETLHEAAAGRLEGSLAYMSPEQTGRVNRPVDTRSDLYSLGATLYECLTGRVPFADADPAEVLYGHVAREPAAPSVLRDAIPPIVDALVLRLLAKSADRRYQSALGAANDLAEVADRLERGVSMDGLTLGRTDHSARFHLPTRLYGRDAELAELARAFARTAAGGSEFVLVHGWSGVGKTALVAELGRQVTLARGRFVQGKFDQFRRSSPYYSILRCFSELFARLLAESDESIARWRTRILDAVRGSVGVLVEIVPEAAAVVGTHPPAEELDPEAARLRLGRLVTELARVFSRADQPLVMFLDDLQWSDLGSLELLRSITTGVDVPHLMLVGSYRSNEVDAAHPLVLELARIRRARARAITDIELSGLSRFRLTEYIADALGRAPDEVEPLALLVHDKTAGNPFFIREFLRHIHKAKALLPHPDGGLRFDLSAVRRAAITGNVVELLVRKISAFGERAAGTLAAAAALGSTFSFRLLEATVDLEPAALAEDLWFALDEGLITPLDADYAVAGLVDDGSISPAYAFQHDRVQQAAHALLPEDALARLHLRIAELLAAEPDQAFVRADHLLAGEAALATEDARDEAAAVLQSAGARARHAAAYAPGIGYLTAARRLLGPDGLTRRPDVYVQATIDLATCEYLCGNTAAADALFVEAYTAARSDLERANSFVLRVALRIGRSEVMEALELARDGLALCGIALELSPDQAAVGAAFAELEAALAGRPLADLATIPEATDGLKAAALEILNDTAAPAYYVNENLYATIILKMCTISARYGQTSASAFGWALYGVVLGPILNDFRGAEEAARLSRRLQARFGRTSLEAKVALCLCGFVDHWTQPPLSTIAGLEAGAVAGLTAGDPVFATFCTLSMSYTWLLTGLEAGQLAESARRLYQLVRQLGIAEALETHSVHIRLAEALSSSPANPLQLGEDEADWLSRLDGFSLRIPLHMALLAKLELGIVFDDLSHAESLLARSSALLPRSIGTGHYSVHAWLAALVASRRLEDDPHDAAATDGLAAARAQLEIWRAANPFSFDHKCIGLTALEHARAGRLAEALDGLDRAIDLATDAGFVKNAAILADAAARLFRRSGRARLADAYVRQAVLSYRAWGATRRAAELATAHRLALGASQSSRASRMTTVDTVEFASAATLSTTSDVRSVDDWSLVKASQALASEIRFDGLVERLMENLTQSTGGQRAIVFVADREGAELRVVAERRAELGGMVPSGTLASRADVPRGVISYVSRAREPVVLGDLTDPGRFEDEPFVAERRTAALLCVPAVHAGRLEAVIYLDNDVLPGSFTADRVQIATVLAAQLAISLANTRLFEHVDRQARAFARFVPAEFLAHLGVERSDAEAGSSAGGTRRDLTDVRLGDAVRRDMAVLFADLRAYTELSEGMSPEDNFAFVNEYLSRIGPVIREHGGFIDKYIGDAIMALFTSADEAVAAAEGIFARTAELNLDRATRGAPEIRVGVGLHYGSLMLGIVGEAQRLDVTVISDVVNTASRLERLCKFFDARIVASDALILACERPAAVARRRLGIVGVVGRRARVPVYELLGAEPERTRAAKELSRARFEAAVEAAEAGDVAAARATLTALVAEHPTDLPARALLAFAESGGGPLNAPKE